MEKLNCELDILKALSMTDVITVYPMDIIDIIVTIILESILVVIRTTTIITVITITITFSGCLQRLECWCHFMKCDTPADKTAPAIL